MQSHQLKIAPLPYISQNESENLTIYGLNTNFICTTALAEVYAKVVNYLIP